MGPLFFKAYQRQMFPRGSVSSFTQEKLMTGCGCVMEWRVGVPDVGVVEVWLFEWCQTASSTGLGGNDLFLFDGVAVE